MSENKTRKRHMPLKVAVGLSAVCAMMVMAVSAASPDLVSKAVSFFVVGGDAGDTVVVSLGEATADGSGSYHYVGSVDGSQGEFQVKDGDQIIQYHVVDGSEEWNEWTTGKVFESGSLQSNP